MTSRRAIEIDRDASGVRRGPLNGTVFQGGLDHDTAPSQATAAADRAVLKLAAPPLLSSERDPPEIGLSARPTFRAIVGIDHSSGQATGIPSHVGRLTSKRLTEPGVCDEIQGVISRLGGDGAPEAASALFPQGDPWLRGGTH